MVWKGHLSIQPMELPEALKRKMCIRDRALALHMDPLEFRKKNCMRPGYVDPHTHVKCNTYGLAECMERCV